MQLLSIGGIVTAWDEDGDIVPPDTTMPFMIVNPSVVETMFSLGGFWQITLRLLTQVTVKAREVRLIQLSDVPEETARLYAASNLQERSAEHD